MSIIKSQEVYKNLQNECRELDITIADVCNSSGVDRSHIQYWKTGNPSTINNLVKLQMDIDQRKKERDGVSGN